MSNTIKYDASSVIGNSIKSGNFNIGVNNTPVDLSGFYNGISPIIGGYTIYINKAENGPSIYAPKNDTELIDIANKLGAGVSTAADALDWIRSQSNMTVLNSNYPSIVTNGLVLNLDAGFVSSYPKTGTTWTDLSGNGNNGSLINGVSYNSSNNGNLVFDGTNDRVQLTNNITLSQTSDWTLQVWVKSNQTLTGSSYLRLLNLGTGGGSNFFIFEWNNRIFARNSSGTDFAFQTGFTPGLPLDNSTFLLTIIGRNGVLEVYSNLTQTTVNVALSGNLTFNNVMVGNGGFTPGGDINMFSCYNRALTLQEITQNYNAGLQKFIPTDGLVLSLDAQNTNLYATSPTTAYDISGNGNNGTLTNGVAYSSQGDGSWNFDSVDDYIDNIGTTSSFSFIQNTGIFTICAWVRLTEFSTTQRAIMGNNRNVTTEKGFLLARGTASSRIRFVITNGGGIVFSQQWDNYFLDNNWVFVTIVGNGTNVIYYRNGTLFQNGSNLGTLATGDSTRTLSVGRVTNLSSSFFWSGNISQTSIYNTTLSATQISTIYNATKSRYGIQ